MIKYRNPIIFGKFKKIVGNEISNINDEDKATILDMLLTLRDMNIDFEDNE